MKEAGVREQADSKIRRRGSSRVVTEGQERGLEADEVDRGSGRREGEGMKGT